MKLIAIGGEPAVGKSTIVKQLLTSEFKPFSYGLVKGHYKDNLYVVGIYSEGEKFPGTDRLSMAVQPAFLTFLKWVQRNDENSVVLFEGDRLFNASLFHTIGAISEYETHILIIEASDATKLARHCARGDNQDAKFLKAKKTKTANIKGSFPCVGMNNNTDKEQISILAYLRALIRG